MRTMTKLIAFVLLISASLKSYGQDACIKMTKAQMERAEELKKMLTSSYVNIAELKDGYEFTFSDSLYSAVAEWVGIETQCCPFGKFQITAEPKKKSTKLLLTNFKKEDILEEWDGMKEWLKTHKTKLVAKQ